MVFCSTILRAKLRHYAEITKKTPHLFRLSAREGRTTRFFSCLFLCSQYQLLTIDKSIPTLGRCYFPRQKTLFSASENIVFPVRKYCFPRQKTKPDRLAPVGTLRQMPDSLATPKSRHTKSAVSSPSKVLCLACRRLPMSTRSSAGTSSGTM